MDGRGSDVPCSSASSENSDSLSISIKEEMFSEFEESTSDNHVDNTDESDVRFSTEDNKECQNDSVAPFSFVGIKIEQPDDYESEAYCVSSETKYSSKEWRRDPVEKCDIDNRNNEGTVHTELSNVSSIDIKMECEEDIDSFKSELEANENMPVKDWDNKLDCKSEGHSSNEFILGSESQEYPILPARDKHETGEQLAGKSNNGALSKTYETAISSFENTEGENENSWNSSNVLLYMTKERGIDKKEEIQKKYRERHREELKHRDSERRRRRKKSNLAKLSTSAMTDGNPQNLSSLKGTQKGNDKKKEIQKNYRERHREKLKQRDRERRRRRKMKSNLAKLSTSANINTVELNTEEMTDANPQNLFGLIRTQKKVNDKKKEIQKKYRELHREELRERERERRRRKSNLASPSTHANINTVELNNVEIADVDSQNSSGLRGTPKGAYDKNKEYQKKYREEHREERNQRERERRKRKSNLIETSTHANINTVELNNDKITDVDSRNSSGLKGTQKEVNDKKKEIQKKYRELHREELRERERERRQRKKILKLSQNHLPLQT